MDLLENPFANTYTGLKPLPLIQKQNKTKQNKTKQTKKKMMFLTFLLFVDGFIPLSSSANHLTQMRIKTIFTKLQILTLTQYNRLMYVDSGLFISFSFTNRFFNYPTFFDQPPSFSFIKTPCSFANLEPLGLIALVQATLEEVTHIPPATLM